MPFDIEAARAELDELSPIEAERVRERLPELAAPRLTGSDGAADVAATIRETFDGLGYEATELPFSFSTWPGRFGLPAAGAVLALTGVAGALLLLGDLPWAAVLVLALGLALAVLPLGLLERGLRELPWGRVETANLLFTRPGARPGWLLMAHRDSKSQLVPTLVRTGALTVAGLGWLALVALAGLWFFGPSFHVPEATMVAGAALALAGGVLTLSWASNGSPGALDNASGLAALLAVAEDAPPGIGFLVTDGEELGLAGARAVLGDLPPVQGVINVEGLDDRGSIRIAEGYGWRRRGTAPQLVAALLLAGRALDIDIHRNPLPRSVLVDHQPLSAAGIPALTVLRGEWRSLLRVHRPSDSVRRLGGHGAAEAATLLAGAVRLLAAEGRTLRQAGASGHSP